MAKQPTEKQLAARAKFAEQSRARAAERKAVKMAEASEDKLGEELEASTLVMPDIEPGDEPETTISTAEYLELIKQIEEIKSSGFSALLQQLQNAQGPQPGNTVGMVNGKLVGSLEKFSLSPSDYPDPRTRLRKEPRLVRFAFSENYDLMWSVTVTEYTNIEQVRVKEPKFTLELGSKLYEEDGEPKLDPQTGEQLGYIVSRLIMHEDPEAAMVIAQEQGLDVDETNEKAFLDEMRYFRMRDWLIECFYPAPIKQQKGKKEMVVGGKVVETYTITSHDRPDNIPFEKLKGGKML